MSKERELLQRLVDSGVLGGYSFIAEVKELLAQPELSTDSLQLDEQEPVAWMWTRNYEGGGYTNMVFQMRCEADEYAKDSESLKRPDLVRPLYLGVEK